MTHRLDPIFSTYFKMPTGQEQEAIVAQFSPEDRGRLEGKVYTLALRDGVEIPDWDAQWGHYHLYDNAVRFVVALTDLRKENLSRDMHCSQRVADLAVDHFPHFTQMGLTPEQEGDLKQRAILLSRLDTLKTQFKEKYPSLCSEGEEMPNLRMSALKGIELFVLTYPDLLGQKEIVQINRMLCVVEELVHGQYDETSAQTLLDCLLRRESFHPTVSDLEVAARLKEIERIAKAQLYTHALKKADESFEKGIYIVPSPDQKLGKVKPLPPSAAMKEVYAYLSDRALGFGMTAPTKLFPVGEIHRSLKLLNEIEGLLRSASAAKRSRQDERAALQLNQAFSLISSLHADMRDGICSEMYSLYGNERQIDSLGEKLFFNADAFSTSGQQKATAIQNYRNSEAFRSLIYLTGFQGSMQVWIDGCARGFELLVWDAEGGKKLKTAPKTLTHLYAMLGLIKGSMDCSSGNSLVQFDPQLGRVASFWDMDDERSMPLTRDWWHFRLWQMGLPQCAQPFDRATLLLFSDPGLMEKLKKVQTSEQLSPEAYEAQNQRLQTIIELFNQELNKPEITLTPRELFFQVFGGREYYQQVKEGFNNDKRYGPEGIRISPIELFEFHLPEMGRTAWYTGDDLEMRRVGQNMRDLYFPEEP